MKIQRRWIDAVSAAVLLVGVATAWIIFAPMQLGGQAGYIIVDGNSMEPLYQLGDLVVIRRALGYQIGDIVTYHFPDIGPVIHRIVGQVGDRYLLKGDHNTWTDSYLPTRADIIGKAWLHIPGLGRIIVDLRSPWILSILVACAGAFFLVTVIPNPRRVRARRDRPSRKGRQLPMKTFLDNREDWLFVLTAVALVALLLGGVAFTHPLTRIVLKDIQYEQKGVFTYSAAIPDNAHIYDSSSVPPGEPVFNRLSHNVTFRFDYRIVTDRPINVKGSVRLIAQLSALDGWQQTVELQPTTSFTGSNTSVSGTVDLDQIQTILNNLETQTGVKRQDYTIYIEAQVTLKGTIAGQAVSENFTPKLDFQIDPFEMQLIRLDASGNDTLYPSTPGLIKWPNSEPNTLPILIIQLQVLVARWISSITLVLALGGLALLGVAVYRNSRTEYESARIQRKYGPLLVGVRGRQPGRAEQVIDVETIDDLAKLADKDGRSILHAEQNGKHIYFVQDTSRVYRYVTTKVNEDEPPKTKVRKPRKQ